MKRYRSIRHSRSVLRQVEHLTRVEQPVELVQQLGALIAAALWVDKDKQRFGLLRRDRLDDEDLAAGRRRRRRRRRWTEAGGVDAAHGRRPAVAARGAAAAAAAIALLHRRLATTSNRRLERALPVQRQVKCVDLYKSKFRLARHVTSGHDTFDVSSPRILTVSSLSNSTARVVSCRHVTWRAKWNLGYI